MSLQFRPQAPANLVAGAKPILHSVCDHADADAVHAQFDRLLDDIVDKPPGPPQAWVMHPSSGRGP